jgi:hypothetical protein
MCFSATANFAGSAVLGTVGVATLAEVKHRRAFLFAAMPLLFAIHQFIEGSSGWDWTIFCRRMSPMMQVRPLSSTRRDCFPSCCR